MKLLHSLAAAVTLATVGSATAAQPPRVVRERTIVTTHTTTTTRHGPGFHRPRCHTEWRHHHRVQVCR